MNTNLLDELDKAVNAKFNTREFSSIVLDSNRVLYFNGRGQPIIEYTVKDVVQDAFNGLHLLVEEFTFADKLSQGD